MRRRYRSLVGVEVAVVVLTFAVPLLIAARARQMPPPVQVDVAGKGPVLLDAGTTLGQALRGLGIRPKSGNLLDVEGKILEKHAFPGSVTVNGVHVPRR